MTTTTSKLIPFIVIGIVVLVLVVETAYEVEIDLDALIPILAPMGVAGAAKAAIESAASARKALPKNIEDLIKAELDKVVPKRTGV